MQKSITIGGASGYWGESDMATPQFLKASGLDYIVYDYLAEVTMSIMARQRMKDPALGYASDFITQVLAPNIAEIKRQGVKIISNAGGVNPKACALAIEAMLEKTGIDLTVAVVLGDDLLEQKDSLSGTEMFTGAPFPDPTTIVSANAYLGAIPIAQALKAGADIVITGRCVDSAVTLGACLHAFDWALDDWDKLAQASLAGHIIECGPQATGGNHTDWADIADTMADVGYPIAEIANNGRFITTKPTGTGGKVTVGTVGEQMLYEIGDPKAYFLPDVVCDFSHVTLDQIGPDRVLVTGAKGAPAPATYKVSVTYNDGWKIALLWYFIGFEAREKARSFADNSIIRARRKLRDLNAPDFDDILIEGIGDGSQFGRDDISDEVALKIGAKHNDPKALTLLLRESTGMALATPPGLCLHSGSRPKPSPIIRLFSMTLSKTAIDVTIEMNKKTQAIDIPKGNRFLIPTPDTPPEPSKAETMTDVPLIKLAYGRSGDKGDKANIGLLPRHPDYAPYIWHGMSEDTICAVFAHFLKGDVHRYYLPGTQSMNILMDKALGGGGMASLRNDAQGKSYAQILLRTPISIPTRLAKAL